VLLAALVLGAVAALAGRDADRGLGEEVASRITRTAAAAGTRGAAAPATGAAPGDLVRKRPISGRFRTRFTDTTPRAGAAPPAPSHGRRIADALRRIRGPAEVVKHAWIVCLGYERWRHDLEHPSAPTEALPAGVALDIVNTCFNPHGYLVDEE
jgi:hypothetical protein